MATEKRLIDANKLLENSDVFTMYTKEYGSIEVIPVEQIWDAPTVDAVEVVRCKDCKHWQHISEHIPHMECQIFCGAYEHGYPTNADDFCSYGERDGDG